MRDEDLIRMANQISAFFTPYTEEEAVAGIANHIKMFWEPRMRHQILQIAAKESEGIEPLVIRALAEPVLAGD